MRKIGILLAASLSASCATVKSEENLESVRNIVLSGIFFSGEYAYFQAYNGEDYILRIEKEEDQLHLAKLTPLRIDGSSTCVIMKIRGMIDKSNGYLNKKAFSVYQIIRANQIACRM